VGPGKHFSFMYMMTFTFLQATDTMEHICYYVDCMQVYYEHRKQPASSVWTWRALGVLLEKHKLNT